MTDTARCASAPIVLEFGGGTYTLDAATSRVSGTGLLRVSGGTLNVNTADAGYTHGGAIQVTGGAANYAPRLTSTQISLSGNGTLNLANDTRPALYEQTGGTLTGGGNLTLTGVGNTWTAGTMTGGGVTTIAAGAELTLTANYGTRQHFG